MKTLKRNEIHPIKMATNPPQAVVNCGMKVINSNGYIYEYVGMGWVKLEKADRSDYKEIPELID